MISRLKKLTQPRKCLNVIAASSICEPRKSSNCIISMNGRNQFLFIIYIYYCRINIKCFLSTRHYCDGHLQISLQRLSNDYLYFILNTKYIVFSSITLCLYSLPTQVHYSFLEGWIQFYTFLLFTKLSASCVHNQDS